MISSENISVVEHKKQALLKIISQHKRYQAKLALQGHWLR